MMVMPMNWVMEIPKEECTMNQVHRSHGRAQVVVRVSFMSMEGPRDGDGPPEELSDRS